MSSAVRPTSFRAANGPFTSASREDDSDQQPDARGRPQRLPRIGVDEVVGRRRVVPGTAGQRLACVGYCLLGALELLRAVALDEAGGLIDRCADVLLHLVEALGERLASVCVLVHAL